MSDQFNNNDDWSNRNWQDAGQFGGRNNNTGRSLFGGPAYGNQNNSGGGGGLFGGGGGNGKLGGGWARGKNSTFVIVIVLIIVIIYTFYTQVSMNSSITKSTIERVKIESTFDSNSDPCYLDEGTVVEDERAMRSACNTFYQATGVIPFIYFLESNVDFTEDMVEQKALDFYKENITDENHFVVVFNPLDGGFFKGYAIGENAKTVLDDEAVQIFTDYLTKFYEQRRTTNQSYMVNTLQYSSERIMSTLPYSKSTLIFGIVCIAVLIFVVIVTIKRKNDEAVKAQPTDQNPTEKW